MADIGPVPDVDPVEAGRQYQAEQQVIIDALNARNPHTSDLGLPLALQDDGSHFHA